MAQAVMNQLKQALHFIHSGSVDNEQRLQCTRFVEQLKEDISKAAYVGAHWTLDDTLDLQYQHFGYQCLDQTVRYRWDQLNPQQKAALKKQVLEFLRKLRDPLPNGQERPRLIREGIAGLAAEIAKREWPQQWRNFEDELLKVQAQSMRGLEVFLRAFVGIASAVGEVNPHIEITPKRKDDIKTALRGLTPRLLQCLFRGMKQGYEAFYNLPPAYRQGPAGVLPSSVIRSGLDLLESLLQFISPRRIFEEDGIARWHILFLLMGRTGESSSTEPPPRNSTFDPLVPYQVSEFAMASADVLKVLLKYKMDRGGRSGYSVPPTVWYTVLGCLKSLARPELAANPQYDATRVRLIQLLKTLCTHQASILHKKPEHRAREELVQVLGGLLRFGGYMESMKLGSTVLAFASVGSPLLLPSSGPPRLSESWQHPLQMRHEALQVWLTILNPRSDQDYIKSWASSEVLAKVFTELLKLSLKPPKARIDPSRPTLTHRQTAQLLARFQDSLEIDQFEEEWEDFTIATSQVAKAVLSRARLACTNQFLNLQELVLKSTMTFWNKSYPVAGEYAKVSVAELPQCRLTVAILAAQKWVMECSRVVILENSDIALALQKVCDHTFALKAKDPLVAAARAECFEHYGSFLEAVPKNSEPVLQQLVGLLRFRLACEARVEYPADLCEASQDVHDQAETAIIALAHKHPAPFFGMFGKVVGLVQQKLQLDMLPLYEFIVAVSTASANDNPPSCSPHPISNDQTRQDFFVKLLAPVAKVWHETSEKLMANPSHFVMLVGLNPEEKSRFTLSNGIDNSAKTPWHSLRTRCRFSLGVLRAALTGLESKHLPSSAGNSAVVCKLLNSITPRVFEILNLALGIYEPKLANVIRLHTPGAAPLLEPTSQHFEYIWAKNQPPPAAFCREMQSFLSTFVQDCLDILSCTIAISPQLFFSLEPAKPARFKPLLHLVKSPLTQVPNAYLSAALTVIRFYLQNCPLAGYTTHAGPLLLDLLGLLHARLDAGWREWEQKVEQAAATTSLQQRQAEMMDQDLRDFTRAVCEFFVELLEPPATDKKSMKQQQQQQQNSSWGQVASKVVTSAELTKFIGTQPRLAKCVLELMTLCFQKPDTLAQHSALRVLALLLPTVINGPVFPSLKGLIQSYFFGFVVELTKVLVIEVQPGSVASGVIEVLRTIYLQVCLLADGPKMAKGLLYESINKAMGPAVAGQPSHDCKMADIEVLETNLSSAMDQKPKVNKLFRSFLDKHVLSKKAHFHGAKISDLEGKVVNPPRKKKGGHRKKKQPDKKKGMKKGHKPSQHGHGGGRGQQKGPARRKPAQPVPW